MRVNHVKFGESRITSDFVLLTPVQCTYCRMDVVMGRVWIYEAGPVVKDVGLTECMCRACAPTFDDAFDIIMNRRV